MIEKTLTKIRFCFENVEACTIEAKNIAAYGLCDIRREMSKGWYHELVCESSIAYDAKIILKPEANIVTHELYEPEAIFNRIKRYNDIVSVELYYDDKTEEEVYFRWAEGFEYTNCYQTSLVTENGYLIIVVSETDKAESHREMVESIKPARSNI